MPLCSDLRSTHHESEAAAMATVNPVQVQKFLGGLDYPVKKDQLLKRAQEQGADDNVRDTLQRLPEQSFNSPNDVSEAIGKLK